MSTELLSYYAIYFFGAFFFSFFVYALLLRFVRTLGVRNLDEENMIRWSTTTKPSLGGLGFYLIFLLSYSALSLVPLDDVEPMNRQLFGVFMGCTVGFFVGLADDAYNTRPLLKFLGQVVCGVVLVVSGLVIEVTTSAVFNGVFTVLWVVGMMNSLNMLDNMDGITASVSVAAIVGAIAFIFSGAGLEPFAFVLYGVLASLIAFLWFNWHPARMYMGDTGSMFLGVFLASAGILLFWGNREATGEFFQVRQFLIPLMAFLLPITDTTTVFIRRIARGQSPFVGGRDHTTHHLAFLGLSDRAVSTVFSVMAFSGMVAGYWIWLRREDWTWGGTLAVVLGYLAFFAIVQVIHQMGKRRRPLAG